MSAPDQGRSQHVHAFGHDWSCCMSGVAATDGPHPDCPARCRCGVFGDDASETQVWPVIYDEIQDWPSDAASTPAQMQAMLAALDDEPS